MSRARNSLQSVTYIIIFVVLAVATVFAAGFAANRQNQHAAVRQDCGTGHRIDHQVAIQYDKISPAHTEAAQCDKLTIINLDDKTRLIAFGQHQKHVAYDDVEERLLTSGQSMTVTLRDTGQFRFHDHLDDGLQGTFTVNR